MIIIKQAHPLKQILGKQEKKSKVLLRWFSYCITVPVGDVILLYNVLTKELISLDKSEYNWLAMDKYLLYVDQIEHDNKVIKYLYDNWFIVPTDYDDKKLSLNFCGLAELMYRQERHPLYTIVMTMDCNARCFYCYEKGSEKVSMNCQTALDTVDFIKRSSRGMDVSIRWFGGEPLCNSNMISLISRELTKQGIQFSSNMVSNGYLFDDVLVETAVRDWHLKSVQITLDGTEQVYNQRKAYIDEKGSSFVRVTDNIKKLLEYGVKVIIRLNMDQYNLADLFLLCNYIAERYGIYEKLRINARYIDKGMTSEPLRGDLESAYNDLKKLKKHICALGLQLYQPETWKSIRTNYCMADNDAAIVISPTGELRKCEHDYKAKPCGTIYTGIQDEDVVREWKVRYEDNDYCGICPLFPNCIRLRSCVEVSQLCESYIREDKINTLKDAILHYYKMTLEQ